MSLVFVYNASLSPTSLIKDFLSEVLPQREANCKLCDITYSLVFKKKAWKEFLASLDVESQFYLKDQFQRKFPQYAQTEFPCTFWRDGGELELVIPAKEMNDLDELGDLMEKVRGVVEAVSQ